MVEENKIIQVKQTCKSIWLLSIVVILVHLCPNRGVVTVCIYHIFLIKCLRSLIQTWLADEVLSSLFEPGLNYMWQGFLSSILDNHLSYHNTLSLL